MNLSKMRRQRGRLRVTVRPAALVAHPEDRILWMQEVELDGRGNAFVVCSHCKHRRPCPSELYLHEHSWETCGGPGPDCDVERRAQDAREHEHV